MVVEPNNDIFITARMQSKWI